MPKATIHIDIDDDWPVVAAAEYIAGLAYLFDEKKMRPFASQLLLEHFKRKAVADPAWAARSTVPADLLPVVPDRRILRNGAEGLKRRLAAAAMFNPLFYQSLVEPFGREEVLVEGERATVSNVAVAMGRTLQQGHVLSDQEALRVNTTDRVWSQSKPVIHLAYAFRDVIVRSAENNEVPGVPSMIELESMMTDFLVGHWVSAALAAAEALRMTVMCMSRFRTLESQTLQVLARTA